MAVTTIIISPQYKRANVYSQGVILSDGKQLGLRTVTRQSDSATVLQASFSGGIGPPRADQYITPTGFSDNISAATEIGGMGSGGGGLSQSQILNLFKVFAHADGRKISTDDIDATFLRTLRDSGAEIDSDDDHTLQLVDHEGDITSTVDLEPLVRNSLPDLASDAEITAGTETGIRSFSPKLLKDAAEEHGGGGGNGMGTPGPTGPQGPQGEQGIQGEKGDKGDTGNTGPAGQDGQDGAVGPQGPAGPQGPKGDPGSGGYRHRYGDRPSFSVANCGK